MVSGTLMLGFFSFTGREASFLSIINTNWRKPLGKTWLPQDALEKAP